MSEPTIEDYYSEERQFAPDASFVAAANASDRSLYDEADADYEAFWARAGPRARHLVSTTSTPTLEWELPDAQWFVGGTLNVSYNCLDRHVEAGRGDKVALHWEGEPGDTRTITYADLHGRGGPVRQRARAPRRRARRSGRDLHADDPRAAGRDAGLHPHRGGALRDLRRLQPGLDRRSGQRRRMPCASSPPTPATGAAHRRRSRPTSTRRSPTCPTVTSVVVVEPLRHRRRRWFRRSRPLVPRADRRGLAPTARPSTWTPRTCSTCSTPRARRRSPRASCTPPAATSPRSRSPTSTCSTCTPTPTSTGAPPTSAGSPATATSSTGRSPTAPRRSCTRARPTRPGRTRDGPQARGPRTGSGTSSSATASRSSTPRPPPSGRS